MAHKRKTNTEILSTKLTAAVLSVFVLLVIGIAGSWLYLSPAVYAVETNEYGLAGWQIALITVGSVLAAGAAAFVVYKIYTAKKKKQQ